MKHLSTPLLLAPLLGALCLPVSAQTAGNNTAAVITDSSPGHATIAQTRKVVATVQEIDVATRHVVLKGPKGKLVPLTVGPDVRNLDQVKVGDHVTVAYVEALSLTLMKGGKELRSSTDTTDGARTAPGQRPGGGVAQQIKVTADVVGVDRKTHMVTLKGPNQTVEIHVADPAQLKLIHVGDQIDAVYTEALAVSVQPAK